MQVSAYLSGLWTGPSPSRAPACAGPGLEAATRAVSLALGGGLKTAYVAIPKLRLRMPHVSRQSHRVAASIRPRVFLSKTMVMVPAIPCGRAGADWGWFLSWLNTYKAGGRACEGRQRGLTFLIESVIINICQLPICQPQTPAKTGALGRFCS